MEKVKRMKHFSAQVDSFFIIIETLFSRVGSKDGIIRIRTYKNRFSIFKANNIRMIIGKFWESIKPFIKHIKEKDEKFFLDNDLDSLGLKADVDSDATKLKHIWNDKKITHEDKEKLWDIIQVLVEDARFVCETCA